MQVADGKNPKHTDDDVLGAGGGSGPAVRLLVDVFGNGKTAIREA